LPCGPPGNVPFRAGGIESLGHVQFWAEPIIENNRTATRDKYLIKWDRWGEGIGIDFGQAAHIKLALSHQNSTFSSKYYHGNPSLSISGNSSELNFLRYVNVYPVEAAREFRKRDLLR